jgi:cytochrome c oxidase assembly protein subunit 15
MRRLPLKVKRSMTVSGIDPLVKIHFGRNNELLRWFSKFTSLTTLFLIFVGGLVTSTESGLSVPDWPLSYGMLFPPMVGGVFYEHGHRMVATTVGLLVLILAISLGYRDERRWVRNLGFITLGMVILQGVLGGITVLFFLPTPVSVMHGVLAQTFFILTIILAYSQSRERKEREAGDIGDCHPGFLKMLLFLLALIYLQLILGAVMRHTGSGLAIPDFPTMGGEWMPSFTPTVLDRINDWRFEMNLDAVRGVQVFYHFIHRVGAVILIFCVLGLNMLGWRRYRHHAPIFRTLMTLNFFLASQILLGIFTVITAKQPLLTSLHVVTGAATLGVTVLLFLRSAPIGLQTLKRQIVERIS